MKKGRHVQASTDVVLKPMPSDCNSLAKIFHDTTTKCVESTPPNIPDQGSSL